MKQATHQVLNQPTALNPYNAYTSDTTLQHYVSCFGGNWGLDRLKNYGDAAGGPLFDAGFAANRYKPEFHTHDRFGHRVDEVRYHPSYHSLMYAAIQAEHHALPWNHQKPGAHVVRAGLAYLHTQADPGSGCPLTMTFAAVPALRHAPEIAAQWIPKITANSYDGSNRPWFDKTGVTIGMAMTEKQGGSDVRSNTTFATPLQQRGPGNLYTVTGHKWFCSAPMCDAFLILAQTDNGISCLLLPRWRENGSKNTMEIQRLKDKMGNISNASSEVEYRDAHAWLIGDEGRGIATILEMVALTRFDCMVGSSALMRQAVAQAIHHTGGRQAFGKNLHEQPLMQNVLADLALESEAATAISLHLAHALDQPESAAEQSLVRLGTALGKYWICKRAAHVTVEAMECIGGVAVVEDNIVARLYRESPINAIWEGSGNIQCLDVLRILHKEPEVAEHFVDALHQSTGSHPEYDRALRLLKKTFQPDKISLANLRIMVENMAVLWQASTLIQYAPAFIADLFVENRLRNDHCFQFGTLKGQVDFTDVIQRAAPEEPEVELDT